MKIMTIVGARPQFIKLAPVSKELRKRHDEIIVHTGQHYDFKMSKIFFDDLNIPDPDYNLEVGSGTHSFQTGTTMIRLEKIILEESPDFIVVFGDTNSTLAASITAAKLNLPLAHVEAGLRCWDKHFPEETNRIITDHLSDLNFAPTRQAMTNLRAEGISKTARLTGDVMLDCLLQNIKQAKRRAYALSKHGLKRKTFNLLTIHRPDNSDDLKRLQSILLAVSKTNIPTLFPVHPRTRKNFDNSSIKPLISPGKIIPIDPLGYLDFLSVLEGAGMVITDSGGVVKEAYIVGTPCITLLDSIDWVETVSDGWNILLGSKIKSLQKTILTFSPDKKRKKYYGNGKASVHIISEIEKYCTE